MVALWQMLFRVSNDCLMDFKIIGKWRCKLMGMSPFRMPFSLFNLLKQETCFPRLDEPSPTSCCSTTFMEVDPRAPAQSSNCGSEPSALGLPASVDTLFAFESPPGSSEPA